jgi:N-acetylglucosaminyldiphosphoundecaprenol N-acetyl-beta-D-mannosaminyltransferase
LERTWVLGLPLDVLDCGGLLRAVSNLVEKKEGGQVAYLNVHVANVAATDERLADLLADCDIVYCDGDGIRRAARWLGSEVPERMTGADWIWDLAALAEAQAWSLFWLGGQPGVAEAAAQALRARHPALQIQTDHGFHPPEEMPAVVARIQAARPHLVLVGLGTPLQERWMQAHHAALAPAVVWCLGATADFVSGNLSRGPAWLHARQEWLARLVTEPGRLWRRYLLGNARFGLRLLRAGRPGRNQDRVQ